MDDFISRESVLEMLDGIYDCNDMVFENDSCMDADCSSCRWRDTKNYIRKRVERIHAADVTHVVRCKNCRWAVFTPYGKAYGCSYLHPFPKHLLQITEDFFCAYGEDMREAKV